MAFFKRRKAARKAAQLQAEKVAEIREGLHEEAQELGCSYEELMEALQPEPAAAQSQPKAATATQPAQPEPSAAAVQTQPQPQAQVEVQAQPAVDPVTAERERVMEIGKICRAMGDRIPSGLDEQLIEKGADVQTARNVVLDAMAAEFGKEEIVSSSVGPMSTGEINPLVENAMERARQYKAGQ